MRHGATALLVLLVTCLAACGGDDDTGIKGSDFSPFVDHPLLPYTSVERSTLAGSEGGRRVRVVYRKAGDAGIVGATVAKIEVKRFVGGRLEDDAWEYYGQKSDGSVWIFGRQNVKTYAGWLAGDRGAEPSMVMPATPMIGDQMEVHAPGADEHRSTIVALDVAVDTNGGNFTECVQTSEYDPRKRLASKRWYCPGVGLVRVDLPNGRLELSEFS